MITQDPTRRDFIKHISVGSLVLTGMATTCSSCMIKSLKPGKEDLCFLFQGDSITDGNRGRNEDPNHILGHGYCFAVSGRTGADQLIIS